MTPLNHEIEERSESMSEEGALSNKVDCVQHQVERRTFCRTVRRVTDTGEVKYFRYGAEGKPSLNRAKESV